MDSPAREADSRMPVVVDRIYRSDNSMQGATPPGYAVEVYPPEVTVAVDSVPCSLRDPLGTRSFIPGAQTLGEFRGYDVAGGIGGVIEQYAIVPPSTFMW